MLNVRKFNPTNAIEYAWTANDCIILEGKTVDDYNFCRNVFHPMDRFSQWNHKYEAQNSHLKLFVGDDYYLNWGYFVRRPKSKRKGLPPIVHRALPEYEKQDRRAEIALEYFNKENDTDYELFKTLLSNVFSSDVTWYHCNFAARQDVDGKYTCRIFFAEMFGDFSSHSGMMEHWTVTACLNLEGHETPVSCALCSNVIHPTHGILKGVHKSKTYPDSSASTGTSCLSNGELSNPSCRRAMIALEYYNNKNGTDYELAGALVSKGLLSDGLKTSNDIINFSLQFGKSREL